MRYVIIVWAIFLTVGLAVTAQPPQAPAQAQPSGSQAPAVAAAATQASNRCTAPTPTTDPTRGPSWMSWGNDAIERTLRTAGRPDGGGPSSTEIEVGVWLRRHHHGARPAGTGRRQALRRQRQRGIARARSKNRLRLLDVQGGFRRAERAHRWRLPQRGSGRLRRVLRRPARQRLRGRHHHRDSRSGSAKWTSILRPQSPALRRFRMERSLSRFRVCRKKAAAVAARRRAAVSAETLPRSTPTRASILWKTYMVDEPKLRGTNTRSGQEALRSCRRRHLVLAHSRHEAAHGLRLHRQCLCRSAAAVDRCHRRDGYRHGKSEMVLSGHDERQLARRMRREKRRQSRLPGNAGARSRFLGVSAARHSRRPAVSRDPAEVRHRARARSRTPAILCGNTDSARAAVSAAQWGAAADGQNVYFGVGDGQSQNPGGIRAAKLATGEQIWSVPGPNPRLCAGQPRCSASQGGAVTLIPGAVIAGRMMAAFAPTPPPTERFSGNSTRTRNSRQ